jgi:rod shape-determining protein MreC
MRERSVARWVIPRWLVVGLLLLALVLVVVPGPARVAEAWGSRGVTGLQATVTNALGQAGGLVAAVRHAGALREENAALRAQVERLQGEAAQLREIELENQELRQLLGLRALPLANELIPARVVSRDPLNFAQAVSLDIGSDQGVREDHPVVTWRGLVGRVIEVQPASSRVLLVTDASSSVAVRVQEPESRATGVTRGRSDQWLLLQYVAQQEPLQTGDLLITSGIGGVFPAGIPVGKIAQVRRRDQELFQEALVEPTARLGQLDRVYVLTRGALEGR